MYVIYMCVYYIYIIYNVYIIYMCVYYIYVCVLYIYMYIIYSSKSLDVVQSLYFGSKLPSSGMHK